MTGFDHAEQDRLISDLICLGRIEQVDHAAKRTKVRSKTLSAWLPWPTEMGRNYRRWRPLRTGQQVILASPSGDMAQAVIVGMLYTDNLPAPESDPDLDLIEFENGAAISHDISNGAMVVTCTGDLTIEVAGTLSLNASNHVIDGPVDQNGGDLTSDGISVQKHIHPESIGSNTEGPQ